jgi:hypothetical protein
MRRLVTTTIAALALCAAAPPTASAQAMQGGIHLEAEIPFEFVVGGETFPPGSYLVETPGDTRGTPTLTIQRYEDGEIADLRFVDVVTIPAGDAEGGPLLRFQRVGDLNFLDEVVPRQRKARDVRY